MSRTEKKKAKLIYPKLSYEIYGILFSVAKELGRHKTEKQYCDAIERELRKRKIKYKREKVLPASFEGEKEGRNKADFVIEDKIILEVKACSYLRKEYYYQLNRYLEAANKQLGILVNMRPYYIHPKRVINARFKG